MERLTDTDRFNCMVAFCDARGCLNYRADGCCSFERYLRLSAYEDTGMTPEEIKRVQEDLKPIPFGRFRDIMEAEREGRLLVLPCKVGDTVWRIKRTFEFWPDKSTPYVEADAFLLQDIYNFGKTLFLTREEAEEALKGEDNG